VGVDINPEYVREADTTIGKLGTTADVRVMAGDFFKMEWQSILDSLPDPLLIVGNPPWVTNSGLGSIGGANLPEKSNFHGD
jgi:methylase of polypeptide subunit release factors